MTINIARTEINGNPNIYDIDINKLREEVKNNTVELADINHKGCRAFCIGGNNTNTCGKQKGCNNYIRARNIEIILERADEEEFKDSLY